MSQARIRVFTAVGVAQTVEG